MRQEELKDGLVGLTAHLESFLMALRKRRMAEIGVTARHNAVAIEEKEKKRKKKRKKKREKQDKKEKRRKNHWMKMSIG